MSDCVALTPHLKLTERLQGAAGNAQGNFKKKTLIPGSFAVNSLSAAARIGMGDTKYRTPTQNFQSVYCEILVFDPSLCGIRDQLDVT